MNRPRNPNANYGGRQPPPYNRGHNYQNSDYNYQHRPPLRRYQQQQWRPQFNPNYRLDRPPGPPQIRPNFIIQLLRMDSSCFPSKPDVEALVRKVKFPPDRFNWVGMKSISATLFYEQWNKALETMVELWEVKFENNYHSFTLRLVSNFNLASDKQELNDRLNVLFTDKLKGLMEGDLVQKWVKKLENVSADITRISDNRRKQKRLSLQLHEELEAEKKGLEAERDLISKRVEELNSGLRYILDYLENKEKMEVVDIIHLEGEIDWGRIYSLLTRECRRLDEGLPIYAYRQDLLKQIYCQQITVLKGETGSGKSTQLVQFLADSGMFGQGAIVCTQPRKLAAISLTERVREESCGCYKDTSVVFCPSCSSSQEFGYKVMFMTDHCLLQYYMSDKQLSQISCIIVDEAHERSLNTDLLLAMIKNLLSQRADLRLIIMSATADADQLANYFFGCETFHITGRNYPVDIKYVPCNEGSGSRLIASYVLDVVKMVTEIHKTEKDGTILAFLTSQMEVESACEKFQSPSAIVLPLHGKLTYEDQYRVFQNYPGKRKVIFTTNVAETSLTIPGVKYVVDSGMVKESRFDPATGMNVLRVCRISQSSANQRAGRAGRTGPGTCYRLYSEVDYNSMLPHQEPEIRMVHLGVAVLRIIALGIKNVQDFDFVDAPSARAIEMAIRNLVQLGAVVANDEVHELTTEGWDLVKLGIEPRLGKIILKCFHERLGKEGLVLAAVMANASSIFCRVGTEEDKLKSDCLKVQFCHQNGDLFTLLSVYKQWEAVPLERKNIWCWENSINAKSMKRCYDTVLELEACLKNEHSIIVPSYWHWDPQMPTEHDETLKNVILSSLAENVAIYSGYDQLGYEVALTGKHVKLHPSCSLLNFNQRPRWVVFGEVLSVSNEYLVCVTAFDYTCLSTLSPPPVFDFLKMDRQQLQKRVLPQLGSVLLKRFCGKGNSNLCHLVSCIRASFKDERIGIEVCVDSNQIFLYASSQDMEKVWTTVNDALEYDIKLLQNECLEKCLYKGGSTVFPSIALFGAGAKIKHLELEKRFLSVDIYHSNLNALHDRELLMFLERFTLGDICAIHKFTGIGPDIGENEKWGRVTFLTPDAAEQALSLNQFEYGDGLLKVVPSTSTHGSDHKSASPPSFKARISWPRRWSKGVAIVKCYPWDVKFLVSVFNDLMIGDRIVQSVPSAKYKDSIVIIGLGKELSEEDVFGVLRVATNRPILDFFLVRGDAVDNPPIRACQEAILREISPFMPRRDPQGNSVSVQVFQPEPKDSLMRAFITFDRNLHLEAAKALEQIDGKVLPGCLSWQKIRCQQLFHSSVSCPASVYLVIEKQLNSLLARVQQRKGAEYHLERNQNGSYRVKISASATKVLVELRRPLEQLMNGKIVQHADLTPAVLRHLFSRDGVMLMKSIQRDTGAYVLFDKHNLIIRVFGSEDKIDVAEQRLVKSLLELHESKQLEIQLRGGALPPDLMKRVVQNLGSDLRRLKEKVPEAEFSLNAKRHCISMVGTKELKQKVETIIYDLAQTGLTGVQSQGNGENSECPICLCEVEDGYRLEGCTHDFCRLCLVEQCESAIRNQENFPLVCAHKDCGALILLTDLRTLLSSEKLEELFRASLGAFVAGSGGAYRFCPSPDCPSIYKVADSGCPGDLFACGSCLVETCTRCHMEYHPYVSCEKYQEFKQNPDSSLKEWCSGRENVKKCPCCGFTIEKVDGCNHIECRCGRHVCWVCLEMFASGDECYGHLRSIHLDIM